MKQSTFFLTKKNVTFKKKRLNQKQKILNSPITVKETKLVVKSLHKKEILDGKNEVFSPCAFLNIKGQITLIIQRVEKEIFL